MAMGEVSAIPDANPAGNMPTALLITRRLGCGGVERSLLTLAQHLSHPGWQFRLATLESGGELEAEAPHLLPGSLPLPGVLRHTFYGFRLTALAWRLRPRVMITFCLDSLIASCFVPRPPGTRWIASIGSDVLQHLELEYPALRPWLRSLLGMAYRRPGAMVAVSQGLRQALIGSFALPSERVTFIPNPVDVARVQAESARPLERSPFVLAVGRLIPIKGFDLLLRAVAPLRDVRLVILGEGPERGNLLALAAQLGMADRLELPGYEPNPWRYMRSARLVVVPSRSEGFSNVLVEALASQAAVVVSDCPYGPREIVQDGVQARLVPCQNVEALRQAIQELLADPSLCQRLRAEAGRRALDFDAPRVCQSWMSLLSA